MQYTTKLEASQESFKQIIDSCNSFDHYKVVEAVRVKNYDQYEVETLTNQVRMAQIKLKDNLIALREFSKDFNRQYAPYNNKCYSTALTLCRKMTHSIADTKKIFKKLCPVNRQKRVDAQGKPIKVSVFTHSYLGNIPYHHDLFDIDSFPPYLQELCLALCDFCTDLANIMLLCHGVIIKENYIRTHPDLCTQIYKDSYALVAKYSRDTINAIKQIGKELPLDAMSERKKSTRSLQQTICDCYHLLDPSQFQLFVINDVISEGKKDGLGTTESLLWADNHQMALDTRYVIENFDKLSPKGRLDKKQGKCHIKTSYVAMLIEWSGIQGSGHETKFVKYFKDTYHGAYLPPSVSGASNAKNQNPYSREEYEDFVGKVRQLLSNKKDKAISIPIGETA